MLDRIKITITLVFAAIALGQAGKLNAADANPPELMTYQGYLVDGNGNALGSKEDPSNPPQRVSSPANYVVVFRIYSAKTQGSAIWAEQQTVTVDKGYFSVLLGQGSQYGSEPNGDLSAVFDGADASDRFIGITVDIAGVANEIEPRLRLLTSPYAYTARQARRLTDGSGNSNFDKVGNSLELGAGSTPTLTLPEAGGASLVGKLTADLPSWGTGLQIDNGSLVTTMGAHNSSLFHFQTGLPQFYFNKGITINGDIRSYLRDTVIGPSNNTDTYLMIGSGSDKITAKADEFLVQGDSKWLKSQFTSSAAELRTNASKFYLDKSLEVEGSLSVDGGMSANNLTIFKPDNAEAVLSAYGSSQGTGRLYVGQSTLHGGGIIYNGDGTPAFSGGSTDHISFYRTDNGSHHEVFRYKYNSNDVTFNGTVKLGGSHGLRTVTGQYGSVQTVGSNNGWAGYSIDGRYALMASTTHNAGYGMYDDVHNRWMIYTKHTNGTRYASYDGDSNWDFYSDVRLKENIEKESSILNRIMKLDVVKYDFIGEERKKYKELGFIAQEVEPLFPSIVSEQDDDRHEFKVKSLGYNTFGVIAIGGIKELKNEKDNEIAELRSENETLKSRMETLTSEMAVLKARLANSTTQEDRIAKLEELVSKIGQGE